MESLNFALFASFFLLLVATTINARTDPGAYWKIVMKDQTMPEAIQDLINWKASVLPLSNKEIENAEVKIVQDNTEEKKHLVTDSESGNQLSWYHKQDDTNADEGKDSKSGNKFFYKQRETNVDESKDSESGNKLLVYHKQDDTNTEESEVPEPGNILLLYHKQDDTNADKGKDSNRRTASFTTTSKSKQMPRKENDSKSENHGTNVDKKRL